MKKKILIPIVIVVLLLVLFVPIPSGVHKDGGSRSYTALTYKIVDWNRITYYDSVYDDTSIYFFPNNFKSIDELWKIENQNILYVDDSYFFKAQVLEIYENSTLVEIIDSQANQPTGEVVFDFGYLNNVTYQVGDIIEVFYIEPIKETYPAQVDAIGWKIVDDNCIEESDADKYLDAKPVIYLYPEEETEVTVNLTYNGKLTCTYPTYNSGWTVTASPDGTLTDKSGQTYNYLYWEGETNTQYDLSKGFCVKGGDTAKFLETALSDLGLNRREANEFIVYWLPLMEQNPYNIISFQTDVYTNSAQLKVNPNPDTLIRVFMAWQASDNFVELPTQNLTAPERTGFTVVEWGGTEITN